MNILIGMIFIIFFLSVVAGLLPREERPNAWVVTIQDSNCRAEVTCPDCGTRRVIRFTVGMALAVTACPECGRNIVPTFGPNCQKLILRAAQEAAGNAEAAAVGEARR